MHILNTNNAFYHYFPDGVIRLNDQGVILGCNPRTTELLGWNEDELVGESLHEILCPADRKVSHSKENCFLGTQNIAQQIASTDRDAKLDEQWWVKKDGYYINVDIRSFIICDENTKECIVQFSDCTHHQFSESEKKRLSLFAEFNPSPILQLDSNGIIFYANPEMTHLMVEYGFSDEGIPNILPDNVREIVMKTMQGEEHTSITKNYNKSYYSWNFHLFNEGDMPLIYVYGRDISAQKLYERSLKDLVEVTEAYSKQKSQFLASVSHELRTPVNGIIGMSEMLKESHLSTIQYDYTYKINKSAESLLLLLNDILDLSKIEAGKLEIDNQTFDLHQVIYDTLDVIEYYTQHKEIDLNLSIQPTIPRMLLGDPHRIRQVLLNYLSNAVKFTPRKGKILLELYAIDINEQQVEIRFNVHDSGDGIAEDKQAEIFREYTQSELAHSQIGTGLGLSICKKLANLMQGKIGVESTPGKGANFWMQLQLPLQENDIDKELLTGKCLIIGDGLVCELLEEYLNYWQLQVEVVNVEQIDQKVTQDAFDFVILCDVYQIDILESLQQLRTINSKLVLFSIMQSRATDFVAQLRKYEFDGYIFKPVKYYVLKSLLHMAVSRQHHNSLLSPLSLYENHDDLDRKSERRTESRNLKYKGLKVLLVEDNLVNQKISMTNLQRSGFQVELAEDGEQAVRLFINKSFDVIFMDCLLPKMNGYQASEEIRELERSYQKPPTPIIALTADTHNDQKALDSGMNAVLYKPFNQQDVDKTLTQVLGSLA